MMQNAIGRNIKLSIMRLEYNTMFNDDAFTLPDSFDEDEIDIFAELGVASGLNNSNNISRAEEEKANLAILLSDNETEVNSSDENKILAPDYDAYKLPDETISELLEILVRQELNSSEGKEIINNVPGNAHVNLASAKVIKKENEYQISVIIDVDGSGPVRPYAKIKSENNILNLEAAPKSIPSSWIPLHDILRDLLTKAMQMLSSTNFTINNNA